MGTLVKRCIKINILYIEDDEIIIRIAIGYDKKNMMMEDKCTEI